MEGHGEDEDGEAEAEAGDLDTLATRRRSRRTNGHGGSQTILDLYQRVSDKEDKDQEILLNFPPLIENFNTKINELQLHGIWRIRNPLCKSFTWNRSNPFIGRRLDYIFVSEPLLDFCHGAEISNIGFSGLGNR